jgi:hypothetical protein
VDLILIIKESSMSIDTRRSRSPSLGRTRPGIGIACLVMSCVWGPRVPCAAESPASQPQVHVVRPPHDSFVPDVVKGAKGVLHMVYARDRNAEYVRSADNGATWTNPVIVNTEGTVEFKMGERGPKLALGRDGTVHVVWGDCWAPGVKTYVRYARSRDGGTSFESRKTVSSMSGIDGVTVTADGAGHVLAFWHVNVPPQSKVPSATWLHTARSDDDGASFDHDEPVRIDNLSALACSMCMMRARVGTDGDVYLAFRSAEQNIRDFYVIKGRVTDNRFNALRVNRDNWELRTCPMCGPELTVGPDGRQYCAFMSRHRVYWCVSNERVTGYRLHVATPAPEDDEIYPTAVANRAGFVLLVWQVGPMSTTGKATVKWACYGRDGQPTGRQGTVGTTTSGTKATAFVGTDDNFTIVTTAR